MEVSGRLLDYVGTWFQGTRIRGHLDIPLPVRKRWQKIAVALKAIGDLKNKINVQEAMPSFSDSHIEYKSAVITRCKEQIEEIQVESKLSFTLDTKFAVYYDAYKERRIEAISDPARYDMGNGKIETPYIWLANELREELIGAIRRIKGIPDA